MPTDPSRRALSSEGRRDVRRRYPRVAACLVVLGLFGFNAMLGARAAVRAQPPFGQPGSGYPSPSGDGATNSFGFGSTPFVVPTPSFGFGGQPGAFPTLPPNFHGMAPLNAQTPLSDGATADPAASDGGIDGGQAPEGEPVRVTLSPVMLVLTDGGRAVAVAVQSPASAVKRVALDLHFDADRVAVTAITVDPLLSMNGAQLDFKHRLEAGRLRLVIALTATDPSQLPTGSPNIASITFAAVTAGSAELSLNATASSVTTADGAVHQVVLDAPVNVIINDAPSEAMAAEVAAQSDSLVAASSPASEMGGGGGGGSGSGIAGMARDVANRLSAALGGLGEGDSMPLLAWLSVLVGAAVITGLGYVLGRAPEPTGPRVARGLRGRRRGGVDIEHEVVEEGREGR